MRTHFITGSMKLNSGTNYNLQLPVQLVPITTEVVSINPIHGDAYLTTL